MNVSRLERNASALKGKFDSLKRNVASLEGMFPSREKKFCSSKEIPASMKEKFRFLGEALSRKIAGPDN